MPQPHQIHKPEGGLAAVGGNSKYTYGFRAAMRALIILVVAACAAQALKPPARRFDAVVVGSGIGGLSAGALLARYFSGVF